MLLKFDCHDPVLVDSRFLADEVPYNLIYRIIESESSKCLKSTDGSLVFAQSPGLNGWLWMARESDEPTKRRLIRQLVDELGSSELRGLNGEPATVELFAQAYAEVNGTNYELVMTMEAYVCIGSRHPSGVGGTMRPAGNEDIDLVARFLAGFSEEAYGTQVDASSQRKDAEFLIEAGNLYLWTDGGEHVSMANISHRAPRHARINAVYTPPACRKRGYASALVAMLCRMLQPEGLSPMLYADAKNPDSNNAYRSIGFDPAGTIADLRFGLQIKQ